MKYRIEEYRFCKKCGKRYFAVAEDEKDWSSQFCSSVCFDKANKRNNINTHKKNRRDREDEYMEKDDE